MITPGIMMELSSKAQDKFPMSEDQEWALQWTGDHTIILELVEARVLWMLNEAYKLGGKK